MNLAVGSTHERVAAGVKATCNGERNVGFVEQIALALYEVALAEHEARLPGPVVHNVTPRAGGETNSLHIVEELLGRIQVIEDDTRKIACQWIGGRIGRHGQARSRDRQPLCKAAAFGPHDVGEQFRPAVEELQLQAADERLELLL